MKLNKSRKKLFLVLILFLFLTIMINIIPTTFGFMIKRLDERNSASAAKFNINITTPDEFNSTDEKNDYYHLFSTKGEIKSLNFSVSNNGEVDVLCTPYIRNNIDYYIIVSDEIKNEFAVKVNETIDFQLVIMSDTLNIGATYASFFIDIQQFERS